MSTSDHLVHKARESEELVSHLTFALIAQDYIMASLNLSKLAANTAEVTRIAQAAQAGDSADVQAAQAAQLETDQAAIDAAVADQASAIAPLTAEFPAKGPPAGTSLTISPSSASFSAGVTGQQALSISGGVAPYTASGLPGGVTFDGSNLNADTTTSSGTSTVTISDSSVPALTGTVQVSVG